MDWVDEGVSNGLVGQTLLLQSRANLKGPNEMRLRFLQ